MSSPSDTKQTIEFSLRPTSGSKAAHFLTVVRGVTIQRWVPITSEPLIIGRDSSRSFYLPDDDVSRAHCEVRLIAGVVIVRDLGSTNGTFIDGVRVEKDRPLRVSSHLQIGRHELKHELLRPEDIARHEQFARELEGARRYVEALIPAPRTSGILRTEWCFVPSSVLGGDALGYHDLEGGGSAFYVLDVCGHGVAAAMHSASVLNSLRNQTLPNTDFREPAQVLERLNEVFSMEEHSGMFLSIFYGVVDPAQRCVRFSSAGHPPALVIGASGEIRERLSLPNPPVGTLSGRAFGHAQSAFEPGDRLYVFSDGVYELHDREGRDHALEDFERELLAPSASRSPGEPLRLYQFACATVGADLLADDFTLLLVEYAPEATH